MCNTLIAIPLLLAIFPFWVFGAPAFKVTYRIQDDGDGSSEVSDSVPMYQFQPLDDSFLANEKPFNLNDLDDPIDLESDLVDDEDEEPSDNEVVIMDIFNEQYGDIIGWDCVQNGESLTTSSDCMGPKDKIIESLAPAKLKMKTMTAFGTMDRRNLTFILSGELNDGVLKSMNAEVTEGIGLNGNAPANIIGGVSFAVIANVQLNIPGVTDQKVAEPATVPEDDALGDDEDDDVNASAVSMKFMKLWCKGCVAQSKNIVDEMEKSNFLELCGRGISYSYDADMVLAFDASDCDGIQEDPEGAAFQ